MVAVQLLVLSLLTAETNDLLLAVHDRQQFAVAEQGYLFYLTTAAVSQDQQAPLAQVTAFVTASSSRQSVIERCTPIPVGPTLYRIDLRELKWDWKLFHAGLKDYPYSPHGVLPLVIRADWLVAELTDTSRSQLHYDLLYGERPKDRNEFLKFHKVENDPLRAIYFLEAKSGVALAETRWIELRPVATIGGYAWGTRDSAVIVAKSDPLVKMYWIW